MAFFGLIRDSVNPPSKENDLQKAIGNVGNLLRGRPDLIVPFQSGQYGPIISPMASTMPTDSTGSYNQPQATPTPDWNVIRNDLANKFRQQQPTPTAIPSSPVFDQMRQGFSRWSGVPIDQLEQKIPVTRYIPQMVTIAQQHGLPPWLFPTLSVLESSGGQNATYPTNPFNWGVRVGYNPPSIEDTLKQMAWSFTNRPSVGTDYLNKYQIPFQNNDWQTFFQSYEPPSQNPKYWEDAQRIMQYFQ